MTRNTDDPDGGGWSRACEVWDWATWDWATWDWATRPDWVRCFVPWAWPVARIVGGIRTGLE